MKLNSLYADTTVDASHAAQLIKTWFHPDDIIVISGKRVGHRSSEGINVISQCLTAREAVESLSGEDADDVLFTMCTRPYPMDMYINVGTPREKMSSMAKRVRETDLDRVIGIVGDFDVKDSGFTGTEQILEYLSSLKIQPTMIVLSGSGGVHAWWKFDTSSEVNMSYGKDLALRWWTYLNMVSESNYGAKVDKLTDTARMLRLPGTIHYPRDGLLGNLGAVRLFKSDGPSVSTVQIIETSAEAWRLRQARVTKTRESDKSLNLNMRQYAEMVVGTKWDRLLAMANLEEFFNEIATWDMVLEPSGWTFTRKDANGRDEWARPGREGEKSACVNWEESPDVMSLLSTSHDTGLLDLLDAEIPLTKWRVCLRLNFNDDYQALVNWTIDRMNSASQSVVP